MKKMKHITLVLIALILNLTLQSCGYNLHTRADLPFQEIYLRNVENSTLEPGLQDNVRKIAYQTLIDNGFTVTLTSQRVLDIQIKNYRLITLSEIGLNTVEYQIVMEVRAILYNEKGDKIKEFTPSSPFTTYFRTTRDLSSIIADKAIATNSLIRDICDDMVRKLIFETEQNFD